MARRPSFIGTVLQVMTYQTVTKLPGLQRPVAKARR